MPSLHQSVADSHYYIRTVFQGRRMTIQLTPEGVRHLTITLKLRDGDGFGSAVIEFLYEKRWAFTLGGGLGEEVDRLGVREAVKAETPPPKTAREGVEVQGHANRDRLAMSIRMESHDHATLDRSVKDIIEAARLAGAIIYGPTPLPTRVEKYTVVGSRSRRSIEMRTHKRRIDIENVSGETLAVLNRLNLPAGVCISIRPIASAQW